MKSKHCFPETVSSLDYKKNLEDVTTDNNLPVSIIFMRFRVRNLIDELRVSKHSCRFPFTMTTRMHSSRMRTARSLTVSRSICHACPLSCMPPCHTCPPAMHPPAMHAPPATHTFPAMHAPLPCMSPLPHMPPVPCMPPATHTPLPCLSPLPHMPSCNAHPPATHAPYHAHPPCHAHPLPCMPPATHAPLPCMSPPRGQNS